LSSSADVSSAGSSALSDDLLASSSALRFSSSFFFSSSSILFLAACSGSLVAPHVSAPNLAAYSTSSVTKILSNMVQI